MFRSREVESVSVSAAVTPAPARAEHSLRRRSFLLGLGATGAGAAALALKPAVSSLIPQAEPPAQQTSGYRSTAHIENYYRTAKV